MHASASAGAGPRTKLSQPWISGGGYAWRARRKAALSSRAVSLETPSKVVDLQEAIAKELDGINRGIFGVRAEQQAKIHGLIAQLEALSPLEKPTDNLDQVAGKWILRYSTIKIMGTKRSKLGLREFVKIGDMHQLIQTESSTAVNTVDFSVTGFGMVKGQLRITASYAVASEKRVDVTFKQAALEPEQLQKLFEKNYDLLLSIFNPEGWLDITYVDQRFRVGRDSKGNVFVLERCEQA